MEEKKMYQQGIILKDTNNEIIKAVEEKLQKKIM